MLNKLRETLAKFARLGSVDGKAVDELIKEIQRILIQSDVNVKLVFGLSRNIKEKALEEKIPKGLTRREHVIDIVYKELVKFLGEEKPKISFEKQKIMLVGLFGSGKTTTCAKLAKYYEKKGLKIAMICTDTWRPAAYEQLKQLGKQTNIHVYGDAKEKDPTKILKRGLEQFKDKEVVIVDTAGRNALDDKLREELKKIASVLKPDECFLVLSGDIGQAAEKQSKAFDEAVKLTGVIVTKMDSSAKGGGVLSACNAANIKVKFIGVGEKTEEFEIYDPMRFVSRLLGMGDLEALIEKAKTAIEPERAEEFIKGEFTLEDFIEQIESTKKVGSFEQILEMLPGGSNLKGKIPKDVLNVQEEKMKRWKFMIQSMTKQEKNNPDIIDKSRAERIAKGSGTKAEEVRELIKNFRRIKKVTRKLKGGKLLKRGKFADMFKGMKMPF